MPLHNCCQCQYELQQQVYLAQYELQCPSLFGKSVVCVCV